MFRRWSLACVASVIVFSGCTEDSLGRFNDEFFHDARTAADRLQALETLFFGPTDLPGATEGLARGCQRFVDEEGRTRDCRISFVTRNSSMSAQLDIARQAFGCLPTEVCWARYQRIKRARRDESPLRLLYELVDRIEGWVGSIVSKHVEGRPERLGHGEASAAPSLGSTLNAEGIAAKHRGDNALAERLYKSALREAEQHFNTDPILVSKILSNLASLYRRQGRYTESEPLSIRALAIAEASSGADAAGIVAGAVGLGSLRMQQERFDEAEELFERALAVLEEYPSLRPIFLPVVFGDLGILYSRKGEYRRARRYRERATGIVDKHFGVRDRFIADLLANMALDCIREGDWAAAEELAEQAIGIIGNVDATDPSLTLPLFVVGRCREESGRPDQAAKFYERSLRISKSDEQNRHYNAAAVRGVLARCYVGQGRDGEAKELLEEALAIVQDESYWRPSEVAEILELASRLYAQMGDAEQAESYRREALSLLDKSERGPG